MKNIIFFAVSGVWTQDLSHVKGVLYSMMGPDLLGPTVAVWNIDNVLSRRRSEV